MRIPRNLTGLELIKLLKALGYEVTRQTGSHIRIETMQNGQHCETIPRHDPIKIGTLNNILKNISAHFNLTKEELAKKLFE
ncbi:hypothetical protein GCM10027592_34790 [Spirosoma flavus]